MTSLLQNHKEFSRRKPVSEINVTPFVDVMLVLLIVFMITAPLLTTGVSVDLPKTDAPKILGEETPLTISVNKEGKIFIQEDEVPESQLVPRLSAAAQNDSQQLIYVRGDKGVPYGRVMEVIATLNVAGFKKVALVTLPYGQEFPPTRPDADPRPDAAPRSDANG